MYCAVSVDVVDITNGASTHKSMADLSVKVKILFIRMILASVGKAEVVLLKQLLTALHVFRKLIRLQVLLDIVSEKSG